MNISGSNRDNDDFKEACRSWPLGYFEVPPSCQHMTANEIASRLERFAAKLEAEVAADRSKQTTPKS